MLSPGIDNLTKFVFFDFAKISAFSNVRKAHFYRLITVFSVPLYVSFNIIPLVISCAEMRNKRIFIEIRAL